jgi:ubiquinone/menaquinone biosynthesis C-methylase UbiE
MNMMPMEGERDVVDRRDPEDHRASGVDYEGRMALVYRRGRTLMPEAEAEWRRTLGPLVRPGSLVVDVGAGTGRFADHLADWFSARVIAVEPAAAMRAQARRREQVSWVGGGAERLALRRSIADLVWISDAVHYLDLDAAGQEARGVVKPEGRVVVRSTFPDQFAQTEWMRWFPSAKVIDEARVPTVEQVTAAFARSGLSFESRTNVHQPVAPDLRSYAEKIAERAISTLEIIDDEEFERGLRELRAAARTAPPRPVTTPLGVLVFRPDGDGGPAAR